MANFSLTRCYYNQWQGVYALYCMFVMGLMWLYKSLRRSLGDLKGSPFYCFLQISPCLIVDGIP